MSALDIGPVPCICTLKSILMSQYPLRQQYFVKSQHKAEFRTFATICRKRLQSLTELKRILELYRSMHKLSTNVSTYLWVL